MSWLSSRSFWAGKRVLLTGHTGFKGSWAGAVAGTDGRRGHRLALPPDRAVAVHAGWRRAADDSFVDIRNPDAVQRRGRRRRVRDRPAHGRPADRARLGARTPVGTFATNVMGTVHLLRRCARKPAHAGRRSWSPPTRSTPTTRPAGAFAKRPLGGTGSLFGVQGRAPKSSYSSISR